jgi:hypothetical protein
MKAIPEPRWVPPWEFVYSTTGYSYTGYGDGANIRGTIVSSDRIFADYFKWERDGELQKAIWCLEAAVLLDRWEPVT